jgi:hypothetical protein
MELKPGIIRTYIDVTGKARKMVFIRYSPYGEKWQSEDGSEITISDIKLGKYEYKNPWDYATNVKTFKGTA